MDNKLVIYNTFTQSKTPFKPLTAGEIKMYVCGITVYDYCHIGHARVFVAFDVMVRFLRAAGWKVTYVRNITDIDDKIIQRAQAQQQNVTALTEHFIECMQQDEAQLGVLPPDASPRATEHVSEIIALIARLVDQGMAYVADNGDVYYAVEQFKSYGQLAHKSLSHLMSGARVEINHAKRNPLDFVLWKAAKAQEPSWPSPWGSGRPGWHIECSAMSTHCLGRSFDIHGGGADLVFPHHENERAQAEAAYQQTYVNTWMHVGFVQVNQQKMAKSLANFFTIREVLVHYDPEVVRYFLMASHYRSPVNYSAAQLDNAKNALETLYQALRGQVLSPLEPDFAHPLKQRFFDAMNDDFNTPQALSVLFELAHLVHQQALDLKAQGLAQLLKYLANILGLLQQDPEKFFQQHVAMEAAAIEQLVAQRNEARAQRNWALADEIRDTLLAKQIILEDTPQGTIWRGAS
jgi:cysteinyl-tRNA synthetase